MKKNREKQLDAILNFLFKNFNNHYLGRPDQICKDAGIDANRAECYMLLHYLHQDGYVYLLDDKQDFYGMSSKGFFFIESGGYLKKNWIDKIKEFPKRNWILTLLFTSLLSFISAYLLKSERPVSQHIEIKIIQQDKKPQLIPNNQTDSLAKNNTNTR